MDITVLTLPIGWGGTEVHTLHLVEELVRRNHRVTIVELGVPVYSEGGRLTHLNEVKFVHLPISTMDSTLRLIRSLRTLSGTTCLLTKGAFWTGPSRLYVALRFLFRKIIVIEHSIPEVPMRSSQRKLFGVLPRTGFWWYRIMVRARSRLALTHRIVCVSDAVRRQILQLGPAAHKALTIRTGTDSERFHPDDRQRKICRDEWGFSPEVVVFGFIGRLSPEKNPIGAIEGFTELLRSRPEVNARLIIAGDGPLRDELEAHCADLNIANRVFFLGHVDNPSPVYQAIDFLVMPSLSEGLGLSLIEALASGCPAIATDVGGIPEVLEMRSVGWLVPPNNLKALVDAMSEALNLSTDARHQMGNAARSHILRNFDEYQSFARIVDLAESL